MERPYETAQIILQNRKDLKIERIDSLVEISHGLWEGKLESEIREKWPVLLKNWHEKPEEVIMPDGESIIPPRWVVMFRALITGGLLGSLKMSIIVIPPLPCFIIQIFE